MSDDFFEIVNQDADKQISVRDQAARDRAKAMIKNAEVRDHAQSHKERADLHKQRMDLLKAAGERLTPIQEAILKAMAGDYGIPIAAEPAAVVSGQREWKASDIETNYGLADNTVNKIADKIGLTDGDGYRCYTSKHAFGENPNSRLYDQSGVTRMEPALVARAEKRKARQAKIDADNIVRH